VNLETFIFQPDEAGKQVADALIAAAKKGVKVRLLSTLRQLARGARERAEGRRRGVHTYRPLRLITIYKVPSARTANPRVDGRMPIREGSVSPGNAWQRTEQEGMARYPGGVEVPWLPNAADFSEDWDFPTGEILAGNDFYPSITPAERSRLRRSKRPEGRFLARQMLYYVANPIRQKNRPSANAYFLPDKQVRKASSER